MQISRPVAAGECVEVGAPWDGTPEAHGAIIQRQRAPFQVSNHVGEKTDHRLPACLRVESHGAAAYNRRGCVYG